MLRQQINGVVYYRFANLTSYDEVLHGVFTRLGGVSSSPYESLNVGHLVGDDHEAVEANHDLIYQALGISRGDVATAHQEHGSRVALVGHQDRGRVIPATDALITDTPGVALMLRFADCLPVLLYDPVRRAVGLAHAGWRGAIKGIAAKTAAAMVEAYGSRPADIIAGLGPCIGPCCYQVGTEVTQLVKARFNHWQGLLRPQGDGSFHFNLWEANRRQLTKMGVEEIEVSQLCTACRTDEFFSHRAEKGRTGRFAVILGMRNCSPAPAGP
ncbi:MAG: peptidoglycan editing factor PgeF [Anaerolineales bacterium]|nr:peptidoglycan editing factor PgeF [Anaerolineales bacterium]